jgi:hypothetical protein
MSSVQEPYPIRAPRRLWCTCTRYGPERKYAECRVFQKQSDLLRKLTCLPGNSGPICISRTIDTLVRYLDRRGGHPIITNGTGQNEAATAFQAQLTSDDVR